MFSTKYNLIILASVFVIALILIMSPAFAQWEGPPGNPPDGNIDFGFLANPLQESLDANDFSIYDLGSCNNQAQCHALSAYANTANASSLTSGVFGKTLSSSNAFASYGVYGYSDNAGGVAVVGQANSGWAGMFFGSLGATDRVVIGSHPTVPTAPANSGGVIELGRYDYQNAPDSSFIYTGGVSQGHDGIFFDAMATGNGHEVVVTDLGQIGIGPNARNDLASDLESRLVVDGKVRVTESVTTDGLLEVGTGSSAAVRGGIALGRSASVSGGSFGTAIGYGTGVTGFRSMALGNSIDVSGDYSVGIGLDGVSRDVSSSNVLSIMGGKVGVNTINPAWDFEVEGTVFARSTTAAPIIGWGFGDGSYANAGVEGIGDIGVYAFGDTVGLYADGAYGVITRGTVPATIDPPDDPDDIPDEYSPITKLFGVGKVLADVNTPAALGSVVIGGYSGGGALQSAGLGICALSGETAWTLDGTNDYDYFSYCQDSSGKNNYAGFFAGDVYLKNGTLQVHSSLAASNENLIYANAPSAVNGSNLLRIQQGGNDKFRVDRQGSGFFANNISTQANLILENEKSYIDFKGGGTSSPSCKAGSEGVVYYFSNYDALCVCRGASGWSNLIPEEPNGKCTNGVWSPT
jgi:hypothetical protein